MINYAICSLRVTPKTKVETVNGYIHHVFAEFLDPIIHRKLIEVFRDFQRQGLSGRISYDVLTGNLTIK